jgi:transposase-like protein
LENQEKLAKRPGRRFSDEFKRDAVEIVHSSGKSIAQVARELGIYDSTLGSWVKQDEINRGVRDGVTTDEREEMSELRRENARLRMERELLKRAVAFWVRESGE